jgi:hypothetical protein
MAYPSDLDTHKARLDRFDAHFLRTAAIGGLLGGTALFLLMAAYNAAQGMGFWSLLNACFAAFVYKNAGMTSGGMMHGSTSMPGETMPGHETMMMNGSAPIVASHITVGAILHLAMSATGGVAFAVAIALLIRSGIKPLAALLTQPLGYLAASVVGGALLYTIMMYGIAPVLNSEISDSTARAPFFAAHLLFGAVTGAFVYWRSSHVPGTAQPTVPSGLVTGH